MRLSCCVAVGSFGHMDKTGFESLMSLSACSAVADKQ